MPGAPERPGANPPGRGKRRTARDAARPSSTKTSPDASRPGPARSTRRPAAVLSGLVLLAVAGAALLRPRGGADLPPDYRVGPVNGCKAMPPFALAEGFSGAAELSTAERGAPGLALVEGRGGPAERVFRHPSWSSAGYLSAPVLDEAGNVYLVPVPYVDQLSNPPAEQNKVYKVDASKGEMRLLADLPAAAPVGTGSPFGLLAITYDCETRRLYASSVAGSGPDEERGRLFRIDRDSGAVLDFREGLDAFGLTPYNSASGKRLYFGSARRPEVLSLALAPDGAFLDGEPRREMSLAGLGLHGDEKARRITANPDGSLLVRAMSFDYNLVANSERLQTGLTFGYDAKADRWAFVERFDVR